METEEKIKKNVKCCACLGSLESSRWLTVAQTNKIATWKYPIASSLCIKNCPHYAVAFVCENCFQEKARIKYAVEASPDFENVVYHEIDSLESEPEETARCREALIRISPSMN